MRDKVRDEWMARQSRLLDDAFYSELSKRYEIIVESPVNEKGGTKSKVEG